MLKLARAQILSAHTAADAALRDGGLARTAHRADFSHHPVRPGYLYVRSRAISSRCNDNFDEFPAEEITKAYRTFIGKPVFVNHVNHDTDLARGVVIDAALHRDRNPDNTPDVWVEVLMEVDGVNFPKLAQAILAKQVYETSMGCDVDYSICSACGNRATRPEEYCRHIPGAKGTPYAVTDHKTGTRQTSPIREICYGLRFFENSLLVEAPADPTAQLLGIDATGLDKTARAEKTALPAGLKFRYRPPEANHHGKHEVQAWLPGRGKRPAQQIGRFTWDPQHGYADILEIPNRAHRGTGVSDALWQRAHEIAAEHGVITPTTQGSIAVSPEGARWMHRIDTSGPHLPISGEQPLFNRPARDATHIWQPDVADSSDIGAHLTDDRYHGLSGIPAEYTPESMQALHDKIHGQPGHPLTHAFHEHADRGHTAALDAEAAWGGDGSAQPNIRDQIPHIPSRTVRSPHAEPGHDDPATQVENTRVDAPTGNNRIDGYIDAVTRPRHEYDLPEGVAGASQKLPAKYLPYLPHAQRFLRHKWENANRLEIGRDDNDEPELRRTTPEGKNRTRAWVRKRWFQATGLARECDHPGCPPWGCHDNPDAHNCDHCGKPFLRTPDGKPKAQGRNFQPCLHHTWESAGHPDPSYEDHPERFEHHHVGCHPNADGTRPNDPPKRDTRPLPKCTGCGHPVEAFGALFDHTGINCDNIFDHHGHCCPNRGSKTGARTARYTTDGPQCSRCHHLAGTGPGCPKCDATKGLQDIIGDFDLGGDGHDMAWQYRDAGPTLHGTCRNCGRTTELGTPGMRGDNTGQPPAYDSPCLAMPDRKPDMAGQFAHTTDYFPDHSGLPPHLNTRTAANDWNQIHHDLGSIHRGISLHLHPEDHAIVHDLTRPIHERAAHLLNSMHRTPWSDIDFKPGEVGTHWSDSENVARRFSQDEGCSGCPLPDSGTPSPGTAVILHARKPHRQDIDDDPNTDGFGYINPTNVYDHDDDEAEVPLRYRAPVHLQGISWKPLRHPTAESEEWVHERQVPWTHHDLGQDGYQVRASNSRTPSRPLNARTAASTDGYVTCARGHRHWGTNSAAGMAIHHDGHVLLGRRADWVQHGGTWGIPGGALHDGEAPEDGAYREATEELGRLPALRHTHTHHDDHGGWGFHTAIAEADHRFEPEGGDGENEEYAWVHPRDFRNYDLHPDFAASWPHLAPHIRTDRRTAAAEDTSNRSHHTAADSTGVPLHKLLHPSSRNTLRGLENGRPADEETSDAIGAADGRPRARIKIYRAVPSHVTTINPGDWVGLSSAFARDFAEQRKDHHVIATTAEARHIHTDGNDALEWGYNGPAKSGRIHWKRPARPVRPDYAGGAVQLSAADHDFVHGTAPVADRAHRLLQAIPRWSKDTGPYSTGAMHSNKGSYTDDRSEARYDAQDNADNLPHADRPHTLFMLHAPQNSRAISGISFTEHTPPETSAGAYTTHSWNPDEVDEDTGMRHTAKTTRRNWWEVYTNPTARAARRVQAMPPKHSDPAEHPFFVEHPVSAENVVAHWADATPEEKAQGDRWYSDAHLLAHALAHTYANGDTGKAAGVISAYSPRTSWAANMHNAARSLARGSALEVGEGLSIMGVHHRLADKIMNGEDYDKVLKGPKTNAFAKLIHHGGIDPHTGAPMPHVVIDRHALSVAAGERLSEDDAKGFPSSQPHYYDHVAKTYSDAAAAISKTEGRTIAPHQVQATTWLVRIRHNQEEDRNLRGGGGKGRVKNQENQLGQWRDLHPKLLPGGAGPDNMHMSSRLQYLSIQTEAADDRDYLMMHQAPDADGAPLHEAHRPAGPEGLAFPDDVYEHPEWYTGFPDDRETMHQFRRAQGNPDAKTRIYRAVPQGVQHINSGDWVTLSKEYAKLHAQDLEGEGRHGHVLRASAPAHQIRTDGNDLQEWAYHGPREIGMSSWAPKGYKHKYPWDTDPDWDKEAKLAYGETKAPPQVDTLRDDECMVCGNTEGWDGINCPVCQFQKPPDLFMDPDTSVARTMDLRGVGDDAAQMAMQQGADAIPGGIDQSGDQLPGGGDPDQIPGAEPAGGEMEDPQDATAQGEVRTLGDGDGTGDPAAQEAEGQTDAQVANGEGGQMSPAQMPPNAQDVLTCPACGFQTPAGPPVSSITDDPSVPASAGPVAGDVCPNCGKGILVSAAEESGLTPPPEVPALDPQALDAQAAPAADGAPPEEEPEPGAPEEEPEDDEEEAEPDAQSKPKSPAVKRVSSRDKGGQDNRSR